MSAQQLQIVELVRKQPPLVQAGVVVILALILYLAWDRHIAPAGREWSARADRIEQQVRTMRAGDRLAGEVRQLRDTIVTIGAVVGEPQDVAEGEARLHEAVTEIQRSFNISNAAFEMRSRGTLPRGALAGLSGGSQVTRLMGTLRFEATPADAIAAIAALESRKEIVRIESLEMQRIGGRRVSVRMNIETWVIGSDAARPGSRI